MNLFWLSSDIPNSTSFAGIKSLLFDLVSSKHWYVYIFYAVDDNHSLMFIMKMKNELEQRI